MTDGAAKFHIMYYSRAAIILFSTGLPKLTFSTYSFGKPGFHLSVLFVFLFMSVCSVSI